MHSEGCVVAVESSNVADVRAEDELTMLRNVSFGCSIVRNERSVCSGSGMDLQSCVHVVGHCEAPLIWVVLRVLLF